MSRDIFSTNLLKMYESQKRCDVKFICVGPGNSSGKSTIEAHKFMLSVVSDVFEAMFYGPLAQKTDDVGEKNEVNIPDINISILKLMLSFIYGKEIKFENIEVACDFLSAVDKYNCKDALKFVTAWLLKELNPENSIFIYASTLLYTDIELKKACLEFFSENATEVITSASFLNADATTVETIFGLDPLNIGSEIELIKALERYIENNKSDTKIKVKVRPALYCIRFLTISCEVLSKYVEENFLLSPDEVLNIIESLPQKDLSKMPKGFSQKIVKRHFTKSNLQMIRSLSGVFSFTMCFRCVASNSYYSKHAVWDCSDFGDQEDRTMLLSIFEKYKHVSLMEYDANDLKTVHDIYKKLNYVQ